MINQIKIHNFKSIVDLSIPLGKVNVLIGSNGCGKSNILEAVSFASAAAQNRLDYEYLVNRDVRMADPDFMVNAFDTVDEDDDHETTEGGLDDVVQIEITNDNHPYLCHIQYIDSAKRWVNFSNMLSDSLNTLKKADNSKSSGNNELASLLEKLQSLGIDKDKMINSLIYLVTSSSEINGFLTYRPTEHFLRKTFETSILPLGVHGEGLLKYLKGKAAERDQVIFDEINSGLELLDWFDGFKIPDDLMSDEYRLAIGDKYLKESLHFFDQRSTNEGFLFLLFYLTLFNSKDTPNFFAIDNIETALNPRLITKLTNYIVKRCFANEKQVILTTHSPFVLDALDLSNDEIRLFTVRRDIDGHTRIERIPFRENRTMPLSQLWMSGLIGGLPDNF